MDERPAFSQGKPGERFVVGIMALLLLPLACAGAYMAQDFGVPRSGDWQGRFALIVLLAMLLEVCLAFAAFCVVALVWALLRPTWTGRVLGFAAGHVWHALLLLAGGSALLAIVLTAAETLWPSQ